MTGLIDLVQEVAVCKRCPLSQGRTRAVPGEGPENAAIMFIGEGPGFHEDQQGRPFVGAAGQFLDELLQSIGLKRGAVYITNVVKCRPPGNRDPQPEEIAECQPYLDRQIALIKPKVIVTLGRYSMARFSQRENQRHSRQAAQGGRDCVHPHVPSGGRIASAVAAEDRRRGFCKVAGNTG